MFDGITRRYDFLNRLLSFGRDLFWRRALARRIVTRNYPGRFLDLATGSGDQLLAIKSLWPYANLVGLDFSDNMLSLAEKKIAKFYPDQDSEIELVLGDAYCPPFPPSSFDSVTISFGLRNLPDRPRIYEKVLELLKPGGRFLILELFFDPRGFWAPLHRFHLETITPLLAFLLFQEEEKAYRYLTKSILNFPHPMVILSELEEAGFRGNEYLTYTFGSTMLLWGQKPLE
ncbi:MAG: ubiquinone/menaquinone biosynthesis methyltransferase [Deltaproteobacteria bacterium]|jgi:demethylmenaquinone methyltransferase/2-methoxy-6-polyprenyl-1,4-benzoquinol methylase|nr:ubiquinone/menaquinone biosynthesis methyltransferase [Deltaproteobacteria bacterium]